ncbi:FAD-binding oxidoreductase [Nordella sp. HKS 07]|uniref:FAD-binding oxidoreductase n=1 Tax=Nordella sp. HKS 07 TaxID=2712222 RepID=UPI0013E201C5|nr:FAD-binding oxidoreductase [Nordella sp. HKS 07]QIG49525.1 FAD-binding oxidoreductase [Nordella sp. HKS 07]
MTTKPSLETLARLAAVVGDKYAITDPAAMAAYMTEWREIWIGKSPLVLRPASTEEVSRILAIANETDTAIVPQSGNTGLVGGQIPFETGDEVLLSLDRMTRIRNVDPLNNSITVDAGVTLQTVQGEAEKAGRFFPLSLESEGSCRIGGNLSTNAGGLGVLAYGNTRDLCLGLEVVLADGRIWNGLRGLRKDNTGYDLKNLFIGAEGTLGVITGAVMKLFPLPSDHATAFVALPSVKAALDLLALARQRSGGRVTAIELFPRNGFEFTIKHFEVRDPFGEASPWYVLIELSGAGDLATLLTDILGEAAEQGIVKDATIAQSETQRKDLWFIRKAIVEVQKREGGSIKHDISLPISELPDFVEAGLAAIRAFMPGARPMPFGHVGDGNLHFNVSQPVGMDKAAFLAQWQAMNDVVFDVVLKHGGSISAEHGIGRLKRDMMSKIKSPVELQMMRDVKKIFDPKGILNPNKVLPP